MRKPGRPKGSVKKDAKRCQLPRPRCTKKEYQRILFLAQEYAGGNVSRWLVHGALTARRTYLNQSRTK